MCVAKETCNALHYKFTSSSLEIQRSTLQELYGCKKVTFWSQ